VTMCYDQVYDPSVTEIQHALRVTVRATNGHVYPASHSAGSTSGAPPMGARLRLKAGKDISGFTPEVQKIFRAMKRYGLIVADNDSDMYIGGTFDTRWNNDVLYPAFASLTASDFEVVQRGWTPGQPSAVSLAALGVSPSSVVGGGLSTGTVTLSGAASMGGALVTVSSANAAVASVPASVSVGAGSSSASFTITTSAVTATQVVGITASLNGTSKMAVLTVTPPPPPPPPTVASLGLNPSTVVRGASSTGTVTLSAPAPNGGLVVTLGSSKPSQATVPVNVSVPAGQSTTTFTVSTAPTAFKGTVSISASANDTTKTATLTTKRR